MEKKTTRPSSCRTGTAMVLENNETFVQQLAFSVQHFCDFYLDQAHIFNLSNVKNILVVFIFV